MQFVQDVILILRLVIVLMRIPEILNVVRGAGMLDAGCEGMGLTPQTIASGVSLIALGRGDNLGIVVENLNPTEELLFL